MMNLKNKMKIKGKVFNENDGYTKITIKSNEERINALHNAKKIIEGLIDKEQNDR
jgi:acylphosphatase